MADPLTILAVLSFLAWLAIFAAPWRAWSTRERISRSDTQSTDLSRVSVLIPARNEEHVIGRTLEALAVQGDALDVVLVDDGSDDRTVDVAKTVTPGVRVVRAAPRPDGWSGKLWALEQGRPLIERPLTLLLDADIEIRRGMIAAMIHKLAEENRTLVSVMATLRQKSQWERLLVPAFVYFFKMLYPFRLSNSRSPLVAAAAGGCILIETRTLDELNLFVSIRGELIDDCALARRVKSSGGRTWIGLSRDVVSHRAYDTLGPIWDMVSRSAYTQLRHSIALLGACSAIMVVLFWVPLIALGSQSALLGLAALGLMAASYVPTLIYYDRNPSAALLLPAVATLYLAMTWNSAINHWRGSGAAWKGRAYGSTGI